MVGLLIHATVGSWGGVGWGRGHGKNLGWGAFVHAGLRAVQERVLQRHPRQIPDGRTDGPGDHQALEGVGATHADPEQPRGEHLVGAPQLQAVDDDRPGGGLDWPAPGARRPPRRPTAASWARCINKVGMVIAVYLIRSRP